MQLVTKYTWNWCDHYCLQWVTAKMTYKMRKQTVYDWQSWSFIIFGCTWTSYSMLQCATGSLNTAGLLQRKNYKFDPRYSYGALHIYTTTFVQWPNWQPLDYYEVYLAARSMENFNISKMLLNYVSSHFKWSQYCWKTQINVTKMKSVLLEHAKSSVYSHNVP